MKNVLLILNQKSGQNYLLSYDLSRNEMLKTPYQK